MIERAQLQAQLQNWLSGEQNAEQTWHWAMRAVQQLEPGAVNQYEDDLVRDIMDLLVAIPQDLITVEDAEVMLYGLNNPPDEADLAQNLLWNHIDGVDQDARRTTLADDPFYAEYCGPVL